MLAKKTSIRITVLKDVAVNGQSVAAVVSLFVRLVLALVDLFKHFLLLYLAHAVVGLVRHEAFLLELVVRIVHEVRELALRGFKVRALQAAQVEPDEQY